MEGTKKNNNKIFSSIDESIKKLAKRKNISISEVAALLGMSDASLRGKRRGATEFTLFEVLELQRLTGENILAPFDENIFSEPETAYKLSSKKDKAPDLKEMSEAMPAPVININYTYNAS